MLPKPHRLPSSHIRAVFDHGKRTGTPLLQFIIRQNTVKISRFAVVVPARIDKRATVRNRSKRLVREAIRRLLSEVADGWDVVVVVRKDLSGMKQAYVLEQLRSILAQAEVLGG